LPARGRSATSKGFAVAAGFPGGCSRPVVEWRSTVFSRGDG
jgi:hypothetical protein